MPSILNKHVFLGTGQYYQHPTRGRFIVCGLNSDLREHYEPDLIFDDGLM